MTSCISLEESLSSLNSQSSTTSASTTPLSDPIVDLTRRCELNSDASACYTLGYKYYKGIGIEVNLNAAVNLLNKSCKLDVIEACNTLGNMYYNGKGIKRDLVAAQNLYQQSCMADNSEGCYYLGKVYAYYENKGIEINSTSAANMFYRSCVLKNGDACSRLGQMYYKGEGVERNTNAAKSMFQRGCELQSNQACQNLAQMSTQTTQAKVNTSGNLGEGNQSSTSSKNNNDILQKCNQQDAQACVTLALDYYEGKVVNRDISLTKKLLQKGCDISWGPACYGLGMFYYKGQDGFEHDIAKATSLLSRGCALNIGPSCELLGVLYSSENNMRRALLSFQAGCALNSGQSCLILGLKYNQGDTSIALKPNKTYAKSMMEKACNLNVGSACGYLASMYTLEYEEAKAKGSAVDKSKHMQRTKQLITKACELNDGTGCNVLGHLHEKIDHDFVLAKKAYQKGCALGGASSCDALKQLDRQITNITTSKEFKLQQKLLESKQQAKQLESDLDVVKNLVIETSTSSGK